eukprot:UC4_evm1s258
MKLLDSQRLDYHQAGIQLVDPEIRNEQQRSQQQGQQPQSPLSGNEHQPNINLSHQEALVNGENPSRSDASRGTGNAMSESDRQEAFNRLLQKRARMNVRASGRDWIGAP